MTRVLRRAVRHVSWPWWIRSSWMWLPVHHVLRVNWRRLLEWMRVVCPAIVHRHRQPWCRSHGSLISVWILWLRYRLTTTIDRRV